MLVVMLFREAEQVFDFIGGFSFLGLPSLAKYINITYVCQLTLASAREELSLDD
jgi:hypothetical protein